MKFHIESGEYGKNTRYTVEEGTKFIHVSMYIHPDLPDHYVYTAALTSKAFEVAAEVWGKDAPTDLMDYTVTFFTAQVFLELRLRTT